VTVTVCTSWTPLSLEVDEFAASEPEGVGAACAAPVEAAVSIARQQALLSMHSLVLSANFLLNMKSPLLLMLVLPARRDHQTVQ
jgi:hypothetical protein